MSKNSEIHTYTHTHTHTRLTSFYLHFDKRTISWTKSLFPRGRYIVFDSGQVYPEYIIEYTVDENLDIKAAVTRVGLEAWYSHFSRGLPKHRMISKAALRMTTADELKAMAVRANMRLDQKTIAKVLAALQQI